jgi:hypothetical protein
MEYGCNHQIFKDPSAQPRKKAPKIVNPSLLATGGGGAVSNDNGAVELYTSDPEVSEPEDAADGSAELFI